MSRTSSPIRDVWLVGAFLSAVCAPCNAQQLVRLRGVVTDSATGSPVAGAVVSVVDSTNATLAQATADATGRFFVLRPAAGMRLRVIRIGYRPSTRALSADTSMLVSLARIPPVLEALRVASSPLCPGSNEQGSAFQIWEQVRAGLLATSVASRESSTVSATTLTFKRSVAAADGRVTAQSQEIRRGEAARPFAATIGATSLARAGFMSEDSTGRSFYGLDHDVLLDESFAATHCFRLRASNQGRDGQIGLAFEATPGRDTLVEVGGVIWLDASPLALRAIEFDFTGLEPAAMRSQPGGRVEFQTANNGIPVITSWTLRMPRLGRVIGAPVVRPSPRRARRTDLRLMSVEETGGELLDVRWPDGTGLQLPPTGVVGRAARAGSGEAIRDALVQLGGTSHSATTDSAGVFMLEPLLAGRYTVTVVDTALSAWVKPRRLDVTVDVQRGELKRVTMHLPSLDEAVRAACKRAANTSDRADVFGRIVLPSSPRDGRPRLRAIGRSQDGATTSDLYGDVEPDGSFRICGVARHAPIALSLRVGALSADTTITVDETFISTLQWIPQGGAGGAGRSAARILRGVVVDSGNRPIAGVSVSTRSHERGSTDELGRFHVQLASADAEVFDFRRLGFMPAQLSLGAGDDTSVMITMLPAVRHLETVDVVARAASSARLGGFEQRLRDARRSASRQTFITAEEIERRQPDQTTSIFGNLSGLRVVRIGEHDYGLAALAHNGAGQCTPTLYIDGVRASANAMNHLVQPHHIAGVEIYPSSSGAPPGFQSLNGSCPVILIWRK